MVQLPSHSSCKSSRLYRAGWYAKCRGKGIYHPCSRCQERTKCSDCRRNSGLEQFVNLLLLLAIQDPVIMKGKPLDSGFKRCHSHVFSPSAGKRSCYRCLSAQSVPILELVVA